MKTMQSRIAAQQTDRGLTIIRHVNGQQIDAQDLSHYTVVSPVISKVIHNINNRLGKSISTNNIGR